MPITILDYVKSIVGDKPAYPADDFYSNGVAAMTGGCEHCCAMLGACNAYPSKSGYWRCADCIGDTGFATVEEFTAATFGPVTCPYCGNGDNITEIHVTTPHSEEHSFECGECGEVWPQ